MIDEFASMVRDLPDFVTGLVNIAQRGRSLGIHLILATQRPSGVVSADIRANTNLRIALRVTDTAESADVIDAPDAALIAKSTPGRAYVRLGHSSLVPFQAGRVGGRRPGTGAEADRPAVASAGRLGRPGQAGAGPARHGGARSGDHRPERPGRAIQQAARRLRIPAPAQPVAAAAPADPAAAPTSCSATGREATPGRPAARRPFGMTDLPPASSSRRPR